MYSSLKDTVTEKFLFLPETLHHLKFYVTEMTLSDLLKEWGRLVNPLTDLLVADFACASCNKTHRLRHLHARLLLKNLPPRLRHCRALGLQCSIPATDTPYHPTQKTLEKLILEGGLTETEPVNDESGSPQWLGEESPMAREGRPSIMAPGIEELEDTAMDGNTLQVLRALGKQGISVKSYDGSGGCTTLKIWGEAVKRYLKLFNIKEGMDQVTVAACFLEGKAKDWWDNICSTDQHRSILNIEQLLHDLQVHFRPLNEDMKLSLQWRNLQQTGDINGYRQLVYSLRTQFPFGEVAEFCLTYHGLKKELRGPILTELWKLNVRHLPLAQLFELAAQAEATNTPTIFPRLQERLRQEGGYKSMQWNNRPSYSYATGYRAPSYPQQRIQAWPPTYRTPLQHPYRQSHPSPGQGESKQLMKKNERRSEDQMAWMRKRPCWICDKTGHLIRECTKRKPSGCPRCGKDHQLKECPSRPKTMIASIALPDGKRTDALFKDVGVMQHRISEELLEYEAIIQGKTSVAIVDTGAQLSLLSKNEAERLGVSWNDQNKRDDIVAADGKRISILGTATISIKYKEGLRKEEVLVAHLLQYPLILGLPWIRKHAPTFDWNDLSLTFSNGEVWKTRSEEARIKSLTTGKEEQKLEEQEIECFVITVTQVDIEDATILDDPKCGLVANEIQFTLEQFKDVFEQLSGIPPEDRIQHEINLVPNAKPVMKRAYRLSDAQQREVEKQIKGALLEGWVQPSYSPWGTAIFVVGKKNGEWRMCVDYRDLNALTEQDAYLLPRIDDILHKVANAKIYSTLDLQSGYHQIQIKMSDRPKTAFRLSKPVNGCCHYEWCVMPFGLKNAPPTFQRYMSLILKDCTGFCEVYMDDIIIYSPSMEEHIVHVAAVLQTLREAQLKVKLKKCIFGQEKVEFLGHVLTQGRIWMRQEKQKTILEWPEPLVTGKEVRQFLGLASYYRNYVPNFASIAAPLVALTRKRAAIIWTWEVQQAFHLLKDALSKNIGRVCWDGSRRTRVTTDASGVGLGAMLEQLHEEKWETVAVWSRALNSCQRNYSILDKEWLAILEAVTRVWKHWLTGLAFEIHTDHAPLVQILTKKVEDLTPRQLRWLERLEPFNYTMKFIKGQENQVADALSRAVRPLEVNAIVVGETTQFQLEDSTIWSSAHDDKFYQEICMDQDLQLQLGVVERKGLLYTTKEQLYVPTDRVIRFKLVLEFHDNAFTGHWSVDKTLQLLQRQYYWPSMHTDVLEVVSTCDVCQRTQIQRKGDQAPIRFIEAQYPWEVVTVDFVSGFKPTARKHTAICVICDRFTRMMHAEPCKDHATAKDTAKIMIRRLFAAHGCPRILISDRGTQFDSELWRHFWNMLGTRVHLTTTHHPQANGLTERMNRTLIALIRKVTQQKPHEWDEQLPLLEFAYNRAINSTTGMAPFEAQQGYLPSIPTSLLVASHQFREGTQGVTKFVDDIRKSYERIHKVMKDMEKKHQESVKAREDTKRRAMEFFVDDEVLVYWEPFLTYSTIPRKQRFRYEGPFRVVAVKPPHCVQLEGLPERMPTTINVEYVHLYRRPYTSELQALVSEE